MELRQGARVAWWMTEALLSAALSGDTEVGDSGIDEEAVLGTGVRVERPTLSDAQIAEVLRVVSASTVLAGELARRQASMADTRAYAARMVAEHTASLRRLNTLLRQQGITPEPSALSEQLQAEVRQILALLRPLQGERFDLGYMDAQVSLHARSALMGDALLGPQVHDERLAQELRSERCSAQVQMEDATALQARLTARC
ncbi:MAG: DUF4142 domain-containing protein [Myxococcaceae bacterium]|nr:DUF4142 domain-containing protein [Myxococcaceae bacterium]